MSFCCESETFKTVSFVLKSVGYGAVGVEIASYDSYGGAQFLGLNGVSIIAHGNAKPLAIKNAIRIAKESIECKMVDFPAPFGPIKHKD